MFDFQSMLSRGQTLAQDPTNLSANPLMGLYQRMGGPTAMPPELVNNPFIKGMSSFIGQIGAAAPQLAPYTGMMTNYLGGAALPGYQPPAQQPGVSSGLGQPDQQPPSNGPAPQNSAYMQPTNALTPPWWRGNNQSASAYGPVGNAMAGMFGNLRQSAY